MRSRVAVASVWTTGHPTPVSARTVPQVYIFNMYLYLPQTILCGYNNNTGIHFFSGFFLVFF